MQTSQGQGRDQEKGKEDVEKDDQPKGQEIIPFINWACLVIPKKCDQSGGDQIMAIIEDIPDREATSISSIDGSMTTNN